MRNEAIATLALTEIAAVLGVSKPAASMLRAGKYDRPDSPLHAQFAALLAVSEAAEARGREAAAGNICYECPREACAGCRVAEIAG